MSLIKRAILALALAAGIAPALAQVPPPVPALPDTERRTTYSISASTCACAVNFALYGDSTDVVNWLEVFLNGVLIPQSGGWTISSSTGPIATIPRPITDAVLTFTLPQTGTVQIVGARRPRRTTQFQESLPVPTRNFNQTFSDIIATQRELWDKTNDITGRGIFAPPGETLKLLPALASRQNMGACFDSSGNLQPCVAVAGSFIAGSGITFTGTNPTTISVPPINLIVNPAGRLTLLPGVAVPQTDQVGATQHCYTPYLGNLVPIYNGVSFVTTLFTEVCQATTDATKSPAAVAASSVYDVFAWNDSGTFRATRGPAWATTLSPGTGAGTSETNTVNGIPVNKFAITNGPGAGLGTLVGTVASNSSSQLMDSVLFRWVWNAYNPEQRTLSLAPTGSASAYGVSAWRQWNASAGNQVAWLQGRPTRPVNLTAMGSASNTTAGTFCPIAIGIDSTTVPSGKFSLNETSLNGFLQNSTATYQGFPGQGEHIAAFLEFGGGGSCSQTGTGTLVSSGIDGYVWQ